MTRVSTRWDQGKRADEATLIKDLVDSTALTPSDRSAITGAAARLVERIRTQARPGMMEVFLSEYGLSTREGVALMCLAEALLRVPDADTIDALIEDKIASSDWSTHLGQSSSPLVNASTWGLFLTGRVLDDAEPGVVGTLHNLVRRLGEPVIRTAVGRAMKEMGRQFVLGETIDAAMARGAKGKEREGFTYSYDMLGEAAMTQADADRYARSYADAISRIATACTKPSVAENPGISIKLSALHPRYELAQAESVITNLVPVVRTLARQAARAGMGLNIDAEEADRLALSMRVIEGVLNDPDLPDWDGFGVVVQAYGRRAGLVIDGLFEMAKRHDRRIMVRLVKGAYWDTEIKHAQVEGLSDFPVFTTKAATDVSYIANAKLLLTRTDRLYPQFATHNAHTVAAILHMAKDHPSDAFEFQRLHGMGEALHDMILKDHATRCRIYAPVGAHRDLLAYLVRRLLENGANSSFVNQIVDKDVPPKAVAACPFEALGGGASLPKGPQIFAPERVNSIGFDLNDASVLEAITEGRAMPGVLDVGPLIAGDVLGAEAQTLRNPATQADIGRVRMASAADVETALAAARPWSVDVAQRSSVLNKAASLYEENAHAIFSLLAVEAGKTMADCVAELREAVDFLRYYAARAKHETGAPRGVFACISPWNFPLAIFSGQIAAALATGNAVLAKPAETTPAIATLAVQLLHDAGVPVESLQVLPGQGAVVGAALASDHRVGGVAFTGSTATAKRIQAAMADTGQAGAPLIAETGGLNAMIVDSTALPEQAVRDIVASAFQSAGQRCSALRCLYVQEDIAAHLIGMIKGAMDQLTLGNPWDISTDIGPVITKEAAEDIRHYIAQHADRVLHRNKGSNLGNFVPPTLIKVRGIADLTHEVFGPVLHVATFKADEMSRVLEDINASGYGLTFGLHTRIDDRIQSVAQTVRAGNLYANRNQIGAVVGSQPFGGEGLSGTGPKAGGPHYLARFTVTEASPCNEISIGQVGLGDLQARLAKVALPALVSSETLPGPTGELNRLSTIQRPPILCLGPGPVACRAQVAAVEALGGLALAVPEGVARDVLRTLDGFSGILWWGNEKTARDHARVMAEREGAILPVITSMPDLGHAFFERHLCVDTTAAGGNAELLAGQG
ncbi:MAG: bifunctional proline dehydrogenase/L-glutamate gamma-semialdehyde dehydrogenase PutA [Pseudomonadota bacterium]